MQALRRKFVERALAYIGVPYAKRYHGPGSPQCNSPLFLDCCALVRRVVSDLQEDFGFTLGRWNQAYQVRRCWLPCGMPEADQTLTLAAFAQFDTLPRVLQLEELQPGDLVFYSGSYYNPRAKRQHHDMVHVVRCDAVRTSLPRLRGLRAGRRFSWAGTRGRPP